MKPEIKVNRYEEDWKLMANRQRSGGDTSSSPIFIKPQQRFRYYIVIGLVALVVIVLILSGWFNHEPVYNSRLDIPIKYLPETQRQQISYQQQVDVCKEYNWPVFSGNIEARKIYDLFLIQDELDLLEIRLAQLWNEVDYFVIVESPVTFSGVEKSLFVKQNWDYFKHYHSKMIRHTLDLSNMHFSNAWERETLQRNAMYDQVFPKLTGAQEVKQGDIILVSDADEIPRNQILSKIRNCAFPKKITLGSHFYYYSYQFLHTGDNWGHPQATFYDGANTLKPQEVRGGGSYTIQNASWHCSYCFSKIDDIVKKIKSFSHQELNNERFTNRSKILHRVINGIDMYDRANEQFIRVENNKDIPEFVELNRDRFIYMIDRKPPTGNFDDFRPEDAS